METYADAVDFYGKNKINAEFNNKGETHAVIVASKIFEYANESVRIFTGSLNSEVADNPAYLEALKLFVKEKKKLCIVIEKMPNSANMSEALKFVLESKKNPFLNVDIKEADSTFIDSLKKIFKSNSPHHFMVGDDISYRIEEEEYKAICNFNDKKIASKLKKIFDSFFFAEK